MNTSDTRDYDWFVSRLEVAKTSSSTPGKRDVHANCPVHGGSDSLHVTETAPGKKPLVKCFAADCSFGDIEAALADAPVGIAKLAARASQAAKKPRSGAATVVAKFPAYSVTGEHVADQLKMSTEPKYKWDRAGVKPSRLHGGLPTVTHLRDEPVVVVEGHGPAKALNDAGIPAVATVTGKASVIDAVGAAFLHGRRVILSPDEGGEDHMEAVASVLVGIAAEILSAPEWPDDIPDNGDAADFIRLHGVDAMRDHYAKSTPWTPPDEDDDSFIAEWASNVALVQPEPLLLGFLEPVDYTVLFGDGGTGKGVVAAQWVADLIGLGWVVLLLDYEQNTVMEWAPRVKRFGGDLAKLRVVQATGAIWDHADRVRDEAESASEAHGGAPLYVVVDSIGYAIGDSKLEDSATATKYKKSLNDIGRPTLSLAHTTKASADAARWPFGSVFWHNNVRHTISITKAGGDEDPRILANKKANRRGEFEPVEVDWSWVRGDLPPSLTFSKASPPRVATSQRIAAVLVNGPMNIKEIKAAIAQDGGEPVEQAAIAQALSRGDEFSSDGKRPARWSLFAASLVKGTAS